MADVVGVVRLILAAVFAVAGWMKLSDPVGTRQAVRDFGIGGRLTRPVALILPLGELTTAGLLLFRGSAVLGAIAALVLLGLFIVAISVNMARGNRVDCNCFGQLHSTPIGASTLVRNLVLGALAVLVIAEGSGGTNVWDSLAAMSITGWLILALILLVLGGAAFAGRRFLRPVARRLRRSWKLRQMRRSAGLPVGSDAPRFELSATSGDTVSLPDLLTKGRP